MQTPTLYLLPGFLTDKTIYKDFLSDERLQCKVLEFIAPEEKDESIESYAKRVSESINISEPFSLLGTSFGGILAIEISKYVTPQSIIFVSSVKSRSELNPLMRVKNSTFLLDYVPSKMVKKTIEAGYEIGSKIAPNLKEIDSAEINEMIHSIDGKLEKWIIKKINTWRGENTIENFLHLHGDKDNVFPIKNIENYELIKGGNHNMIIVKSEEVREKVFEFLIKK